MSEHILHPRFQALRLEKGWSLEDVGEKIEVTPNTVYRWENGNIPPSLAKMVELAYLYDVSLSYSLGISNVRGKLLTMEITLRLESLRKERKWSRPTVALSINVHKNSIFNWESGGADIKLEAALDLADAFGVSLDYMLGLTDLPRWETEKQTTLSATKYCLEKEISKYETGTPFWIEADDLKKASAKDGFWGLLSEDKSSLTTVDGTLVPINSAAKLYTSLPPLYAALEGKRLLTKQELIQDREVYVDIISTKNELRNALMGWYTIQADESGELCAASPHRPGKLYFDWYGVTWLAFETFAS